ncbi:oleate hydratase [Streptomyces sp. NPDC002734]|uniref:Oleate hydratase n=1 Tax=Streptomyces fragilis TaxID=67301 RepID=A0ABV2YNK0_9ACTN|nr:oleate hydratase [Streptomyces fragilis]
MAKAYLVGSGVAALAAAVFLIRDGGFDGGDVHLFEERPDIGGSLNAGGTTGPGHTVPGGRLIDAGSHCAFDLLSGIPSLDDPSVSVAREILEDHESFPLDDVTRLVDGEGRPVDPRATGLSERDRLQLLRLLALPERSLDGERITDCFGEHFFTSAFWLVWSTTFAFRPGHSAVEFRRHLRRFAHLLPEFATMSGDHRTRYHQYDSLVLPLVAWLRERGVSFHTGCRVVDLALAPGRKDITVRTLHLARNGQKERIAVAPEDLVLVTNGAVTDAAGFGSHTTPPPAPPRRSDAWLLWHRMARGREDLGDPAVFDKNVKESLGVSFTVTTKDPVFLEALTEFSGRETGRGGLMTLTGSPWLLSVVADRQPVHRDQPEGVSVWWGYGLFPDRRGARTPKPMTQCSGQEILEEVLHHLPLGEAVAARVRQTSTVVPCLLPYFTGPFLRRTRDDRPRVVPRGSVNLAFVGHFAELPDEAAFTVEYSVRTAWTAVSSLLDLGRQPPPVHKGYHDRHVLAAAAETLHHR